MPELRNHKQELFARFLADDHSQSESYELAGYRPSTANASTLANRPEIKARVDEIREEKMERKVELERRLAAIGVEPDEDDAKLVTEIVVWTVAMVQRELFLNTRLAQSAGEFGAANKSLELLGKSVGMWEDAKKAKDDGSSKPQVGIALIGDALGRLEITSGDGPTHTISPLAPRVSSAADAERVPRPRSTG